MQYNQNPSGYNSFNQAYGRPNQGNPRKDNDEKESGSRWWLRYVIVPIIVAVLGTGVFFGVKLVNPPAPPTPTPASPTIPILHSTYTGTYIDLATQQQANLSIIDLSEDSNTGSFTAAAEDGICTAQITNGTVDSGGHVTFQLDQEFNPNTGCQNLVVNFTGQVNSVGDISGQWTEENTQFNGTFRLA